MFELIKADRHTLDAAADFRCEGAGFIEKYKPFSYDENKLVIGQTARSASAAMARLSSSTAGSSYSIPPITLIPAGSRSAMTTIYMYAWTETRHAYPSPQTAPTRWMRQRRPHA